MVQVDPATLFKHRHGRAGHARHVHGLGDDTLVAMGDRIVGGEIKRNRDTPQFLIVGVQHFLAQSGSRDLNTRHGQLARAGLAQIEVGLDQIQAHVLHIGHAHEGENGQHGQGKDQRGTPLVARFLPVGVVVVIRMFGLTLPGSGKLRFG